MRKMSFRKARLLREAEAIKEEMIASDEDKYDCGCAAEIVYASGHFQVDYDGVDCSSCGYKSCLDCHHINSQSDNHYAWKCYEGYGCNKKVSE